MNKPTPVNANLILVEGKDDREVLYHLLSQYGFPRGIIECKPCESDSLLLAEFSIRLKKGDLDPLGVVIDADDNLAECWQSLKDRLSQAGYTAVPTQPSPEGTILRQTDKPTVGIWIMPDNQLPGMLEDFIGFLVPQGDLQWQQARACLLEIPEAQRRFKQHLAKAHVHTWLAWQEEPGTPLGSAITKRYLDADAEHAKQLIGWVRTLFEIG
jgi:hypothetical protein